MSNIQKIRRFTLGTLVGLAILTPAIATTTSLAGSPWDTNPGSQVHLADGSPWDK